MNGMTELLSGEDSMVRVKVEIRDDCIVSSGRSSGGGQIPLVVGLDDETHNNKSHSQVVGYNNNPNNINVNISSSSGGGSCLLVNNNIINVTTTTTTVSSGSGNGRTTWTWPNQQCSSVLGGGGSGSGVIVTAHSTSDGSSASGGGSGTHNINNNNNNNNTNSSLTISSVAKNLKTNLSIGSCDGFPSTSTILSCRGEGECLTGGGSGLKGQVNAIVGIAQGQINDVVGMTSKEELILICQQLQNHIESMQRRHQEELNQVKESEDKLRIQQLESSRRENVLVMRLTTKEQEMQEYAAQLNELKASMVPTSGALRSTLLDPAVNFIIQKMRTELEETKKKLEDTQNDLNAWKFTPDSNTGKRLMAKCRMLYQENEELGKMVSSGRLAKLESDLALQKSLTVEMKKSQSELDELVQELDEDVEGMQSTILFLQQQLRKSNSSIAIGIENQGTGSSTSDSPLPGNNSSSKNYRNNEIPATGLVQVRISDLCAQCRTVNEGQIALQLTPDNMNLATSTSSNAPVDSPVPPVENFDRTCVNGEADESHSKSTSNLSVQNVVNLNTKECDETDGGPPTSKRTKLHGDTAVVIMHDHSSQSLGAGSTSSFNGNGSVEY